LFFSRAKTPPIIAAPIPLYAVKRFEPRGRLTDGQMPLKATRAM
jgi:hypothetical protein